MRTSAAPSSRGSSARSAPGARSASGKPRADREFFHQRGERTYWVPLLGGGGDSGALHVAAAPGGDELRALPAAVGECACWDGHDAAAGFVPNQTGAATVGLEFRAIPFEEYREDRERSVCTNAELVGAAARRRSRSASPTRAPQKKSTLLARRPIG